MEIGEIIKEFRCSQKLSQAELSMRSGVPQATISDIEHGTNPTWKTVTKISTTLGIKLEDLLLNKVKSSGKS